LGSSKFNASLCAVARTQPGQAAQSGIKSNVYAQSEHTLVYKIVLTLASRRHDGKPSSLAFTGTGGCRRTAAVRNCTPALHAGAACRPVFASDGVGWLLFPTCSGDAPQNEKSPTAVRRWALDGGGRSP